MNMKRIFTIVILLSLVFSSVLALFTHNANDSLDFAHHKQEMYKDEAGDTVIRVFYGYIKFFFANGRTVYDLNDKDSHKAGIRGEYYAVVSSSNEIKCTKRTNDIGEISVSQDLSWNGFIKYIDSPELVFDSSYMIKEIYVLASTGASSHVSEYDDIFIYYVTNKGDYVLYLNRWPLFVGNRNSDHVPYLMTKDIFYEYVYLTYNTDTAVHFDLAPYELRSPLQSISRYLVVFAVVFIEAASAFVVYIIYRKNNFQH